MSSAFLPLAGLLVDRMISRPIGPFLHPRQRELDLPWIDVLRDLRRAGALQHLGQPRRDAVQRPGERVPIGNGVDMQHLVRFPFPSDIVVMRILAEAVEPEIFLLLPLGAGEYVEGDAGVVELRQLADVAAAGRFERRPDRRHDIIGQEPELDPDADISGLEILGMGIVRRDRHPIVSRDMAIHSFLPGGTLGATLPARYTSQAAATILAARGPSRAPRASRALDRLAGGFQ